MFESMYLKGLGGLEGLGAIVGFISIFMVIAIVLGTIWFISKAMK